MQALRQGSVEDLHDSTIADHLVSEVSVLAIGCQAVEASDELFGGLSLALCSPGEPCLLEDNVLLNLEELIHLAEDLHVPFSVGFAYVRTSSASLPRQYSKVLICHSSLSPVVPDVMWNYSKRLLHFGHSSGLLTFNFAGVAVDR